MEGRPAPGRVGGCAASQVPPSRDGAALWWKLLGGGCVLGMLLGE